MFNNNFQFDIVPSLAEESTSGSRRPVDKPGLLSERASQGVPGAKDDKSGTRVHKKDKSMKPEERDVSPSAVSTEEKKSTQSSKKVRRKMIIESDSEYSSDKSKEDHDFSSAKEARGRTTSEWARKESLKRTGPPRQSKRPAGSVERGSAKETARLRADTEPPKRGVKRKRDEMSGASVETPKLQTDDELASKDEQTRAQFNGMSVSSSVEVLTQKKGKAQQDRSKPANVEDLAGQSKPLSGIASAKTTGDSEFAVPATPPPRLPSPMIPKGTAEKNFTAKSSSSSKSLSHGDRADTSADQKQRLYTLQEATKLLNSDWNRLSSLMGTAAMHHKQSCYEEGLAVLNQAIAICERHEGDANFRSVLARACHAKGSVLAGLHRREEASNAFKLAYNLDKQSTESLVALGYLDLSCNNLIEARGWFSSALELNPKLDTAKRGLAQYHLCTGEADETLRMAGELITAKPWDDVSWKLRGQAFLAKGDLWRAAEAYAMVVYIHPSDEKAWISFKGVTKRLDEANNRDGQKISATLFWWCADKGIRLANEDMYSKATTYFERASYCYEGAGEYQKELDLELSECYNFYAICLHHIGDSPEQVLPWFDMAVRLNPANYIAWTNKGITLEKLDRPSDAMDCYSNALKVKPSYERAHVNFCMLGRRLTKEETRTPLFAVAL